MRSLFVVIVVLAVLVSMLTVRMWVSTFNKRQAELMGQLHELRRELDEDTLLLRESKKSNTEGLSDLRKLMDRILEERRLAETRPPNNENAGIGVLKNELGDQIQKVVSELHDLREEERVRGANAEKALEKEVKEVEKELERAKQAVAKQPPPSDDPVNSVIRGSKPIPPAKKREQSKKLSMPENVKVDKVDTVVVPATNASVPVVSSENVVAGNDVDPLHFGVFGGVNDTLVIAPPLAPQPTFFLSITSFRDILCAPTMIDLFQKATYPERLFIGLVEQHSPLELPCIGEEILKCKLNTSRHFCPMERNIIYEKFSSHLAKGPTWARYLAGRMYTGQHYFFQLDSHNVFKPGWDEMLIEEHNQAVVLSTQMFGPQFAKAVVTHYPLDAYHIERNGDSTSHMCYSHFHDEGFVRFDGELKSPAALPRLGYSSAGGFTFTTGDVLRVVPHDPHLQYLFDGEEFLYTVRMWTNGYNMFSPKRSIIYHYFNRPKAPLVWGENPTKDWVPVNHASVRRLKKFVGVMPVQGPDASGNVPPEEVEFDKYWWGKQRSFQAYLEFAGIDVVNKAFTKNFCKLFP